MLYSFLILKTLLYVENCNLRLTVETMDLAPILQQPLGQHDHGVAHGRRTGLAVVQPLVAVQDEHALLVRVDDLIPEISALNGGRQVDFSGGQPPEHDGRYAQVHGVADVTVGELH